MSPIVFIVFAPVVVGGVAAVALLLGAATAGVWEAAEGRSRATTPPVAGGATPRVGTPVRSHARAA